MGHASLLHQLTYVNGINYKSCSEEEIYPTNQATNHESKKKEMKEICNENHDYGKSVI